VETQRQWSDLAILRTTPALLGLFSLGPVLNCWIKRRVERLGEICSRPEETDDAPLCPA
jgi:hypothetical protein